MADTDLSEGHVDVGDGSSLVVVDDTHSHARSGTAHSNQPVTGARDDHAA